MHRSRKVAFTLILAAAVHPACDGGKSPSYPDPECTYDWSGDWTGAPCSGEHLQRVRCDPCSRAWRCEWTAEHEEYPVWVRQSFDCTCRTERWGNWHDHPGCGGEATSATESAP